MYYSKGKILVAATYITKHSLRRCVWQDCTGIRSLGNNQMEWQIHVHKTFMIRAVSG